MTTHELAEHLWQFPDLPVDFVINGEVHEPTEILRSFKANEVSIFCDINYDKNINDK